MALMYIEVYVLIFPRKLERVLPQMSFFIFSVFLSLCLFGITISHVLDLPV